MWLLWSAEKRTQKKFSHWQKVPHAHTLGFLIHHSSWRLQRSRCGLCWTLPHEGASFHHTLREEENTIHKWLALPTTTTSGLLSTLQLQVACSPHYNYKWLALPTTTGREIQWAGSPHQPQTGGATERTLWSYQQIVGSGLPWHGQLEGEPKEATERESHVQTSTEWQNSFFCFKIAHPHISNIR